MRKCWITFSAGVPTNFVVIEQGSAVLAADADWIACFLYVFKLVLILTCPEFAEGLI